MWRETRFSFSGRIQSINYPTKKISFILLEGALKLIFKLWSNNEKIYKKDLKFCVDDDPKKVDESSSFLKMYFGPG